MDNKIIGILYILAGTLLHSACMVTSSIQMFGPINQNRLYEMMHTLVPTPALLSYILLLIGSWHIASTTRLIIKIKDFFMWLKDQ